MNHAIKIMAPGHEALTQNTRFQVYTERQLDKIRPLERFTKEQRFEMHVVANVLPFRVNQYVIDELIDWNNIPADPVFQLTFPQRNMLEPEDFERMAEALRRDAQRSEIQAIAVDIRSKLNPHPAGQQEMNVPVFTAGLCRAHSTNTAKPCCSSPARGRCVIAIAPSASAGRSLSATRSCALPAMKPATCTSIWLATRMLPIC